MKTTRLDAPPPLDPGEIPTDDPFGRDFHDHNSHMKCSGRHGHYCPEWDYLWICEDCPEFEFCPCELQ